MLAVPGIVSGFQRSCVPRIPFAYIEIHLRIGGLHYAGMLKLSELCGIGTSADALAES